MNNKELIDNPIFAANDMAKLANDFSTLIVSAHNQAVKKHPMTGMTCKDDMTSVMFNLTFMRMLNNADEKRGDFSWRRLFKEEIFEAVQEIVEGNYCAAQSELVQVAQVAFRAWLWCEQQKQDHLRDATKKVNEEELENY